MNTLLYSAFCMFVGLSVVERVLSELCSSKECYTTAERLQEWLEPSVNPCDDFFEFACGNLKKKAEALNEIKPDGNGGSMSIAKDLKEILLDDSGFRSEKPFVMVRKLFKLCTSTDESTGSKAFLHLTKKLGGCPLLDKDWSEKDWNFLNTEINLAKYGLGGKFISVRVGPNTDNWTVNSIQVDADIVGRAKELSEEEVMEMKQYLFKVFSNVSIELLGETNVDAASINNIMEFIIEFNQVALGLEPPDYSDSLYVNFTLPELQDEIPWVNWQKFINGIMPDLTIKTDEVIQVSTPEVIKKIGKLIEKFPKKVVANFMMALAFQDFKRRYFLENAKGSEERTMECLSTVMYSWLGLALASLYARKHMRDPDERKTKIEEMKMAKNMQQELLNSIEELPWLDKNTRDRAKLKISKMKFYIGYPLELLSLKEIENHYKGFEMDTTNFYTAMLDNNARRVSQQWLNLKQDNQEIIWSRDASDYFAVNAYYSPTVNRVEVTGAIMSHFPTFNVKNPAYIKYGGFGIVFGHELIHSLDNEGSEYNEVGELEDWWDKDSKSNFINKTKCFIDQYDGFTDCKHTKLRLNGERTQGENMADNGGLALAYRAYRKLAAQLAKPEPHLPGLQQYSPDQLFLITAANNFCAVLKKKVVEKRIKYDVHSPREFRVNGMMMNFQNFSKIFKCGEDDYMNPENKCKVW